MRLIHLYLWFPMILLAFANAMFRETVLKDHFRELRAEQFSTFTLILFCGLYVLLIFPKLQINTATEAIWLGLLWTILTFLFETLLGKLSGHTWGEIFQNYNISDGHIWPLFLIFLLFLPSLVLFIKR